MNPNRSLSQMPQSVTGMINVIKPSGITSMDVVRRVRKASGMRRVGHSGTLDPLASGVMIVAFGIATRLLEYITQLNKGYNAVIELGTSTTTYDGEGEILDSVSGITPNESDIKLAIQNLKGRQSQIPPMYSAIKINGNRLYELARKGITIERPPRSVDLHDASISNFEYPELELEITCSKGFYVRTFANDLGEDLGTGAYLKELVRTSVGPFHISDSLKLDFVEKNLSDNKPEAIIHAMERCLDPIQKLKLEPHEVEKVRNGISIPAENDHIPQSGRFISMALTGEGDLAAIMRLHEKELCWKPEKVFHDQMPKKY